MSKEQKKGYYRLMGEYYGYPSCCIAEFAKEIEVEKTFEESCNSTEVSKCYGFLPCKKHTQEILEGKITLESLIINRQHPQPFPLDDDRRTIEKFKASLIQQLV